MNGFDPHTQGAIAVAVVGLGWGLLNLLLQKVRNR